MSCLRALVVGLCGLAGCGRAPASIGPTDTSGRADLCARRPDFGSLDWLARPPGLDAAALAALADRAKRGVDVDRISREPSVGREGRPLVDPSNGRAYLDYAGLDALMTGPEPDVGARGELLQVHQRLFAQEPWASLEADGTVTVRFRAVRAVPAANLYYGMTLPSSILRFPRYRKREAKLTHDQAGGTYGFSFALGALLDARSDAAGVRASGRGEVVWRVEAIDLHAGSTRLDDGTLAFRCARLPCSSVGPFVQLPSFTHGPVVDRVALDSAVVSFATDAATVGRVLTIDAGGEERWHDSTAHGTRHEVLLSGLAAASRYRYYVAAIDARGEVALSAGATFRTAPASKADARFRFAFLSDSRSGHGAGERNYAGTNRALLVELFVEVLRRDPDFAVFVGDLADGYTTEAGSFRYELDAWHESVQPVAAYLPIYETTGNHEALLDVWDAGWAAAKIEPTTGEAIFAETVVNPENGPSPVGGAPPYAENTYSFDHGNTHLAVVNSNYFYRSHAHRRDHPAGDRGQREGWLDDATLAWLDADLGAARERGMTHLFVFTHEPAFPTGGHARDGMYWNGVIPEVLARRDEFVRMLARHGVVALVHGDEHNYSRLLIDDSMVEGLEKPIWQIISGGAGAPYHATLELPWSNQLRAFDVRQHFVIVNVDGEEVTAETLAVTGEVLDRFRLDQSGASPGS